MNSLKGEEWREIPFEWGHGYLVSNYGRVWSEKSKGILVSRYYPRKGKTICLYNSKKRNDIMLARLVYAAFHGPESINGARVYYKDGNRENCALENLIAKNLVGGKKYRPLPKKTKHKLQRAAYELRQLMSINEQLGKLLT